MIRISYQWLKDLIDLPESPQEIQELLTHLGFEVEEMQFIPGVPANVVAGYVLNIEPHPNAEKLKIVAVGLDGEIKKIVCGAPNIEIGQWVPVALEGAKLREFTVSSRNIRGVESNAVICSEYELGRSDDHSGIWVLGTGDLGEWTAGEALENRIASDTIFSIEVTLNRADCLSHLGIARELSAKLKRPLHLIPTPIQELDIPTTHVISVQLDDPIGCLRYRARVMKNVDAKLPAPFWMRERLRWMGTRAINAIVDVTNYVMYETGHPLHAFDRDFLSGNVIGTRKAYPNETFYTLDEVERVLSETDVLIRDAEKAVALGGIMGGLNSQIRDTTKDLLLEAAYFDPITIRTTARRLGISSESSKRFERGADINGVVYALDRAASLIQMLSGGEVYYGVAESYPNPVQNREVTLRLKRLHTILGYRSIPLSEANEILNQLQCQTKSLDENQVTVLIPSFRHDLQQEIDLIEEVARIKGYQFIPANDKATIPLTSSQNEHWLARMRWNEWARQFGLSECISNTMVNPSDLAVLGLEESAIKIANPIASEMSAMRNNLIVSLILSANHNIRHGRKSVAIFEIGKVFGNGLIPSNSVERWHLGIALSGASEAEWWNQSKPKNYSASEVLGILERLPQLQIQPTILPKDNFGILEEAFLIYLNEKLIGYAGKVEGAFRKEKLTDSARIVAKHFDLDQPIWIIELNTEAFPTRYAIPQYQPFSRFPEVERDLSFIVPETMQAEFILKEAKDAIHDSNFLVSVSIFDRHHDEKNQIVSIGIRLRMQSFEKTLSEMEINEVVQKVLTKVCQIDGVKLRSA